MYFAVQQLFHAMPVLNVFTKGRLCCCFRLNFLS